MGGAGRDQAKDRRASGRKGMMKNRRRAMYAPRVTPTRFPSRKGGYPSLAPGTHPARFHEGGAR